MARILIEISDFADLLRDAVNRAQPLYRDRLAYGKGSLSIALEVTAHHLESVCSDGPIVLICELSREEKLISVEAIIPSLELRLPYTLVGGAFLVKDGTRTLEICIDGGVSSKLRFTNGASTSAEPESVKIELRGFQLKLGLLPAWVERRLGPPITKKIEHQLERLICQNIPAGLSGELAAEKLTSPPVVPVIDSVPASNRKPGRLSLFAYSAAYYLSFGVAFPAQLVVQNVPVGNSAARGLRDGAAVARHDVRRLRGQANRSAQVELANA